MLQQFRCVSIIEGLSLLALLFVAMPLKYYWAMPEGVKYVGMTHGLLWIVYLLASLISSHKANWPVYFWLLTVGLSVLPFGFLLLEYLIRRQPNSAASSSLITVKTLKPSKRLSGIFAAFVNLLDTVRRFVHPAFHAV